MRNKRPYLLFHIIGWLAFFVFQFAIFPHPERFLNNNEVYPYLIDQLVVNGLVILFFYIHYYWLIPKFYFEKKSIVYVLSVMIFIGAAVYLVLIFHHEPPPSIPTNVQGIPEFSENPLAPPRTEAHSSLLTDQLLLIGNILIKMILAFLLSLGIRIYARWQTAEEEKYKAELSFLKAQINPHFLFNTLNGIYALAVKKSENTSSAIMKLSSIMRYVMNEGHHNFVSLDKELNYITDYIDLQKMRLSENIHVDYQVDAPDASYKIAPLVLIPFVENTFKHGISTENECNIKIHIKIKDGILELVVENKKYKMNLREEERSGIGVKNTEKRLHLLYPGKHHLNTFDSPTDHMVVLKLNLA